MISSIAFVIISVSVLQIACFSSETGCPLGQIPKDTITVPVDVPFPVVYPDVDSMLKILELPQFDTNEAIQDLLHIYYKAKEKKTNFENLGGKKKYPLIVLEGLSGSGKTTLAFALARKINGIRIHSPSKAVKHLKPEFRNSDLLDNVFHRFAHYITALEAYVLLDQSPVIIDRYWHSTTSYALARAVYYTQGKYHLPPKGNEIYNWPEDLLTPDLVLFLNIDEHTRKQRLHQRLEGYFTTMTNEAKQIEKKFGKNEMLLQKCPQYKDAVIQAYKNMENPDVTIINSDFSLEDLLENAYSKVKPLLLSVNDS